MGKDMAKEGGHWYRSKDGKPAYEMPNKSKGGTRPTTVRDFRVLSDTKDRIVPSVTTIVGLLDKPGLVAWKIRQVLESAYTCPLGRDEDSDKWIERVKADAEEQAKTARERGTALHGMMEKGFQGKPVPPEYQVRFNKVCAELAKYGVYPKNIEAEKSFATERYGGKVDILDRTLYVPVVADIKTGEFTLNEDGKPIKNIRGEWKVVSLTWPEHIYQLAGYAGGLAPDAVLLNIFVSTIDDSVYTHKWSEGDIDKGTKVFNLLTELWWAIKGG